TASRLLTKQSAIIDRPPSLSAAPLLESKFLASREQTDRFANALLACLRTLRRMNPGHEVTTVGRRQFLEKLPSLGVLSESLGDIVRQVRDNWCCGIRIVRRRRCNTGLGEQAGSLELSPPFSIEVRPFACRSSRRHLQGVSIVIDALDQTIDPAEAQRLSNHIFVRD